MLDIKQLQNIKLQRTPIGQLLVGELVLRFDYLLPKKTEIVLEGLENIPRDRGVYLAMNHTDRYNYWPFQYQLYREGLRYTAAWVKGKYYSNSLMAAFLGATNNIPLPSRGYVLTHHFMNFAKRQPTKQEYRVLRSASDEISEETSKALLTEPTALAFVKHWGGEVEFSKRFTQEFVGLMQESVRLTDKALNQLELNLLVFPQGTRSKRLSEGRTGLMQMAMATGHAIVPVGCNGSDRVYPGASPFAKGGRIVYRIGAPIEFDSEEMKPFSIGKPYTPFTKEAESYQAQFKGATALVMDRINDLLDEEYQYSHSKESDGVKHGARFV